MVLKNKKFYDHFSLWFLINIDILYNQIMIDLTGAKFNKLIADMNYSVSNLNEGA
jgi:hypothetical protein